MRNIRFVYKSKIILDNEEHKTILYEIEHVNLARIKIMLTILGIVQIIFIVFNDIRYYINPTSNVIWKDSEYFVIHLLLLFLSVIGYIVIKKLIKSDAEKWMRVYHFVLPGILVVYLILISLLSILDQITMRNYSNLFIANLILCGAIFILNFPSNLYTYSIPFLCYIGNYFFAGFERDIIFSNIINGFIFFIAVVIISTSIYNFQYEITAKNIILENANQQLHYISGHDPLTGLLNRRCFMEQMEKKQVDNIEPVPLLLVDVDYFKNINDKYGHPVGDTVLKKVSLIFMEHMKEGDLVARWGGEEFLLLLYNTSMEEANAFTNILRIAIEELTIQGNGFEIQVTASFGIAALKSEGDNSFYTAYKIADQALYQAKKKGRNCVVKGDQCI